MNYPETTVFNCIQAKRYPRIRRVHEMVDYFDVNKSDLRKDSRQDIMIL